MGSNAAWLQAGKRMILESCSQELLGIDVKAAATVAGTDFNGLRHLRDTAPAQFKRGVLLYTGEQVVHFDEQLTAVPVALLL